MKIALISDSHGMLPELFPDCDAIIHAGDIGIDGIHQRKWYQDTFFPWVQRAKVPFYATWGNHDFTEKVTRELEESAPANLDIVVDQSRTIGGLKFWFSPWSPVFGNWAWMKPDLQLVGRYNMIPEDTQVIISHGPPKGAGDKCLDGYRAGSLSLRDRMLTLPNLKMVVCGHIHEDMGLHHIFEIPVLNVSSVDENYYPRLKRWFMIEFSPFIEGNDPGDEDDSGYGWAV